MPWQCGLGTRLPHALATLIISPITHAGLIANFANFRSTNNMHLCIHVHRQPVVVYVMLDQ